MHATYVARLILLQLVALIIFGADSSYEASRYVIFSILLLLSYFRVKIFS
jgi:hypothetical protein